MTLRMSARLKYSHARGGSNPAGAQIDLMVRGETRTTMVERAFSPVFFFSGGGGFHEDMKMHTEIDRCSSYLMLVTHEKQSDFWRFLSNDPIGWKILSEYVVFPRSALGLSLIHI